MNKKNCVIIIPEDLKNARLKVKFSYLALRNFIYYTFKGLNTYTKGNRDSRIANCKSVVDNYFQCHKQHSTLTDEEIDLIKKQFDTKYNAVVTKNDYILATEKELGFNKFVFYCNCMVELSYHIGEDYCNDEFIISLVEELSKKMMVNSGSFPEFILQETKIILQFISDLH